MRGLWLRWSWRDLRARWPQVAATALTLAVGVGGFAGLRSLEQWRVDSARQSFAALRAADLRIDLGEGGYAARGGLLEAIAGLPSSEVAAAQERLVVDSQLAVSREAVAQTRPIRAADDAKQCRLKTAGVRRPPNQTVDAARECRWSFRRLWVAAIRRHSERAAALPLRLKRSIRRFALIWAKTGSTIHCLCE